MEDRCQSGFPDQGVGDDLEHLGVEGLAFRLRFPGGPAHGLGALLEFDADSLGVGGSFVAIPGDTLDPHLSDVAAETPEAIEQDGIDTVARRAQSGGKTGGAAADDKDFRFRHDGNGPRGFFDVFHCLGP